VRDVPLGHRRDRRGREDRTRGGRADLSLADRARNPVSQPGDRRGVETDDRWQAGEARVGEAARHRGRPHREPGARVATQVAPAIAAQRRKRRHEPLQLPDTRGARLRRRAHRPMLPPARHKRQPAKRRTRPSRRPAGIHGWRDPDSQPTSRARSRGAGEATLGTHGSSKRWAGSAPAALRARSAQAVASAGWTTGWRATAVSRGLTERRDRSRPPGATHACRSPASGPAGGIGDRASRSIRHV
jgi:hypothetical protein